MEGPKNLFTKEQIVLGYYFREGNYELVMGVSTAR